jgi:hypothetical protein
MAAARRVTIDLTEDTSDEMNRVRELTGLSIADIFRHAFTLLRLYVDAKASGKQLRIFDPKNPREHVQIELPTIPQLKKAGKSATASAK